MFCCQFWARNKTWALGQATYKCLSPVQGGVIICYVASVKGGSHVLYDKCMVLYNMVSGRPGNDALFAKLKFTPFCVIC